MAYKSQAFKPKYPKMAQIKVPKMPKMQSPSFFKAKGNPIKPIKVTKETFKPLALPHVRQTNLIGKVTKF
jgi:hypothetical protein